MSEEGVLLVIQDLSEWIRLPAVCVDCARKPSIDNVDYNWKLGFWNSLLTGRKILRHGPRLAPKSP